MANQFLMYLNPLHLFPKHTAVVSSSGAMAAVLVGPVAAALLRLLQEHYATHQCSFFTRSSREEHTSGAAAAVSLTSAAAALLRVTAGAAAEHLEGPEVRPATWAGPGKPKAPRHRALLQQTMANQNSISSRHCTASAKYIWCAGPTLGSHKGGHAIEGLAADAAA